MAGYSSFHCLTRSKNHSLCMVHTSSILPELLLLQALSQRLSTQVWEARSPPWKAS